MLIVFLIVGGFIPLIHAEDFSPRMLSKEDKVITGLFHDSVLLSLPPCTYAGQNVDLDCLNVDTNMNYNINNAFTVPSCDAGDINGPTVLSRKIGYQLMNLASGTKYMITYTIGNIKSKPLTVVTRTAANYEPEAGFPGRSAAMVVITVILTVAMSILLISIIITTLVFPNQY